MTVLTHLTLNTGHIARTKRDRDARDVAGALLPVISAEGGAVPGLPGWYLDFMFPIGEAGRKIEGGAFFQIADEPGTSKRPVVMAVAAWAEGIAPSCWEQALFGYQALREPLAAIDLWRNPPESPPPLPWLAVWLTPFTVLADAETLTAFGSLERHVAWTLIP